MTGSIVAGQTTSRTGRYKAFPVIGTVLMGLGALFFSRLAGRHHAAVRVRRVDPVRARPGLHDAAAGAGRAERRAGPGHGRRDVVVAVLPADGRHPGDRRVPVGAVLDGRPQHRGRVPDRVADAGVPGGGRRPGGRGRPRERARPGDAAGRRRGAVAGRLVVHQRPRPAARAAVPRRLRAVGGHRAAAGRVHHGVRRDPHDHAPRAAAAERVGHPGPVRRRRRCGCRAELTAVGGVTAVVADEAAVDRAASATSSASSGHPGTGAAPG